MSTSESLDPEEPGDPSPHKLGVYIVCMYVCMYACSIQYFSLTYILLFIYGGHKYILMFEYCFCK